MATVVWGTSPSRNSLSEVSILSQGLSHLATSLAEALLKALPRSVEARMDDLHVAMETTRDSLK